MEKGFGLLEMSSVSYQNALMILNIQKIDQFKTQLMENPTIMVHIT